MARFRRWNLGGSLASAVLLFGATAAPAFYLDDGKLFKLTGVFYTQERIAVSDTDEPEVIRGGGMDPSGGIHMGQLIQLRNYALPVFEGELGRFLRLGFVDDLSFRFAGRFVYDAVYDLGTGQFGDQVHRYRRSSRFVSGNPPFEGSNGLGAPGHRVGGTSPAAIYQGTKRVEANDEIGPCGAIGTPFFSATCEIRNTAGRTARERDMDVFDPRKELAREVEPWEIYFNVQKGPLFVRIGRQNLSWGETDGRRLLDVINPLNLFFGLAFDEDLDEQRIPLWMIRVNYQLFSMWGPFSSAGMEAFLVPGVIDTTQGPFNISGNHPYGPPSGCDPQLLADSEGKKNTSADAAGPPTRGCTIPFGLAPNGLIRTSVYERLPPKRWSNSRFGARLTGVVFDSYTVSVGAYQTYADIPQPRVHYRDVLGFPATQNVVPLPTTVLAEVTHGKETIIGGSLSFFQPHILPGVVRSEVGYFLNEPAYVNVANQGIVPTVPLALSGVTPFMDTFVPRADYLRWMIGYDLFQLNVPWISQTNNIIVINQWFAELNLSSDGRYKDILRSHDPNRVLDQTSDSFAFGIPQHDGKQTVNPKFNSLGNNVVQAFLMHGLLVPQFVFVWSPQGWFSLIPNATYRLRDDLLIKVGYTGVYGSFISGGFFRDRDQVGVRLTYLLN
ncbi:MAG: DUF1302 family protein [Candidatus Binatia bacterium]